MPPPCITFCRAAASRVHPQPPFFVRASWLLRRTSLNRLHLSTRLHLTTDCVVAITDAQASLPLMRRRLCRRCNCNCRPRHLLSSWHCWLLPLSLSMSVAIVVIISPRDFAIVIIVCCCCCRPLRHCHHRRLCCQSRCCHW